MPSVKPELNAFIKTLDEATPYPCHFCSYRYQTEEGADIHMRARHPFSYAYRLRSQGEIDESFEG